MNATAAHRTTDNLIFWGWIAAVLLCPIGFIVGIVLLTRDEVGHGIGMMTVAFLLMVSLTVMT